MPHSNTANSPTGPAPIIATSLRCIVAPSLRAIGHNMAAARRISTAMVARLPSRPVCARRRKHGIRAPHGATRPRSCRRGRHGAARGRASPPRRAARDTIALAGPLGSGKTSFARAFIRALGDGDEEVPSPTFTLVETYRFAGRPPIWHFDLYRLERAGRGLRARHRGGLRRRHRADRMAGADRGAAAGRAARHALAAGPRRETRAAPRSPARRLGASARRSRPWLTAPPLIAEFLAAQGWGDGRARSRWRWTPRSAAMSGSPPARAAPC